MGPAGGHPRPCRDCADRRRLHAAVLRASSTGAWSLLLHGPNGSVSRIPLAILTMVGIIAIQVLIATDRYLLLEHGTADAYLEVFTSIIELAPPFEAVALTLPGVFAPAGIVAWRRFWSRLRPRRAVRQSEPVRERGGALKTGALAARAGGAGVLAYATNRRGMKHSARALGAPPHPAKRLPWSALAPLTSSAFSSFAGATATESSRAHSATK